MNIETFREICLSMPETTEDFPFDDKLLVFRLAGKIFAGISMDKPNLAVMKCDSTKAVELREQYSAIEGAFHWNKKYWNQIGFNSDVSDRMIADLVKHAYAEVLKKLPKKERERLQNL